MADSPHVGPAQLAPPHHPSSMPPSSYQEVGTRNRRSDKLGLFRKRSTPTPEPAPPPPDDNDEWLVEGESRNGHVNAHVSVGREASTLSRSTELPPADDAQTSASTQSSASTHQSSAPPERRVEKRLSKSRSLAKKTSRLFQRNSTNGSHRHHSEDDTAALRHHQQSGRQSSFSSTASETGSSRTKHWSLSRTSTNSSPRASPETHQPSSWHPGASFTLRRSSSVSYHSHSKPPSEHSEPPAPQSTHQPRRYRDSAQFHHSVGPGTGTIRGSNGSTLPRTDTVSSRMSSWLTNIMPTGAGSESAAASPASPAPTAPPVEHSTPTQPPQAATTSPLRRPQSIAASIFSAARNKAASGMRYLLDSDAQPDHCQDTMWVMGVGHPGWTPRQDDATRTESEVLSTPPPADQRTIKGRDHVQSTPPQAKGLGNIFGSGMNMGAAATTPATPPSESGVSRLRKEKSKEVLTWPDHFYDDFKSRVWCTYREQYAPILSMSHDQLIPNADAYFGAFSQNEGGMLQSQMATPTARQSSGAWSWVKGGERGLTSDTGWGCMLRTGQSMLANALIHLHLGRGWRVPTQKPSTHPRTPLELAELEAYSTYVRILSWFMDDPSPICPFSVHRFALIGKELGKEVGEWFGPSTAAGALKTLANSFPPCGLSVVSAADGSVFRSEVYQASNLPTDWNSGSRPSRPNSYHRMTWGGKAVLIVIPTRLGLDGVNPMYYDDIKALFTWPQSVGIAGGRPSSSYYFVASQANSLFYLDPHLTRPAVPLHVPPTSVGLPPVQIPKSTPQRTPCPSAPHSEVSEDIMEEREEEEREDAASSASEAAQSSGSPVATPRLDVVDVDEQPRSSSRLQRRFNSSQPLRVPSTPPPRDNVDLSEPPTPTLSAPHGSPQQSPFASPAAPGRYSSTESSMQSSPARPSTSLPVDHQTAWYASAYPEAALKTFHCERVKKLPLSGLDPSMLLGFLCTTEAEFEDFCDRVSRLPHKFFNVQDEPPTWSDAESGLESVSEPDPDSDGDFNDDDEFDEDEDMEFGRMGHRYVSNATVVPRYSRRSQHSHTLSTSTTSSHHADVSRDNIGTLSCTSSDDLEGGSVETPLEQTARPLPAIATIQLDDDESFEQQDMPSRLPSSQTLRAFPRLSDHDAPQEHIIPPPRKRSLTALSANGPAGMPSKPLPVIMQHADPESEPTPKQETHKDLQSDYQFPREDTVRDLASTARGDSPLPEGGDDIVPPTSNHASHPSESEAKPRAELAAKPPAEPDAQPEAKPDAQPASEVDERQSEKSFEEEDSLVIIDKEDEAVVDAAEGTETSVAPTHPAPTDTAEAAPSAHPAHSERAEESKPASAT